MRGGDQMDAVYAYESTHTGLRMGVHALWDAIREKVHSRLTQRAGVDRRQVHGRGTSGVW